MESGWRRLRRIWRRSAREDVDDEVAFHMQMRVEQFVAAGMDRAAAERAAREQFGDIDSVSTTLTSIDTRRRRRVEWRDRLDGIRHDAVVSLRAFAREPLFTAGVVLTLGLGVGANATMFGIIDGLMLRGPAHVLNARDVQRLYISSRQGAGGVQTTFYVGYVTYATLRDHASTFAGVGAFQSSGEGRLGPDETARPIRESYGTWDLFPTLGVRPVLGRFFARDEDSPPRGANVVVISEELWETEFGRDASVLGKRVIIDGSAFTVIGVAPRGFAGPERAASDVWLPMTLLAPSPDWPTTYRAQWMRMIVRLAPGASAERASAEATRILRAAYTGPDPDMRQMVASVRPLWYGGDGQPSDVANISRWLMGVTAIVLLVTCANVANLLIARARRRRREVAVRLALGAGRGRLVRLLLTETLLLVGAGGLLALGVSMIGSGVMRATLLSDVAWDGSAIDPRLFAFTFAVAMSAGLVIGLAPAIDATKIALVSALKSGAGDGGGRRARVRAALSAFQAALCVILLVGAALFVESLRRSRSADLGFQPDHVVRVYASFSLAGLQGPERAAAVTRNAETLQSAVERLRAMPWIENAALSIGTPFGFGFSGVKLSVPGRDSLPRLPGGGPYVSAVSPGYFATVGTPIRSGRAFTSADRRGSTPVVIVNETMARLLWPGESPLDKCITIGDPPAVCASVVGIAGDVHRHNLKEAPAMQYYVPLGQERGISGLAMLVRPRGDAESSIARIKDALHGVPGMPYVRAALIQRSVDPQFRSWRLGAAMFGVFGALALVIANVGLYSVIAYLVADRTRELGVRIALGASAGRIVGDVVRGGVVVTLAGVVGGLVVALVAGRFVQPLLFDVPAHDPLVLSTVSAVVLIVAVVAAWRPAWRAARVDPVTALRAD